ncbi:MAG: hypothetical protein U1E06_05110 [Tabrizicola sp.]|uniref:hypothetical protein n=1 Tax=Tabrizicola sp. TaxID=2005166 RepID=UPI002732F5E4|nr:hypothetical protein [Tabrizicola sp.]MDP3262595.1 hypothetical protein [Tabrizicola sp.]MDP3647755.1 hypothetical protein [Paracoccaceae bacterium]MDZ4066217.1 hypothetical protein [Tabrizicola sp.]
MPVLLYLLYGTDDRYHSELTFSVASALHHLAHKQSELRIVLVTDQGNQRPDLGVEHILITEEQIFRWQLDGRYNHALKPFVVQHALTLLKEKLAFVDTDTFFLKDPRLLFERVGPGRTALFCDEGALGDGRPGRPALFSDEVALGEDMQDSWANTVKALPDGVCGYDLSLNTRMNNSGIIGIDPADADLLDDVIAVMSALRAVDPVFTAEQLAATIVFREKTMVSFCSDVVDHYLGRSSGYYHYQFQKRYPKRDALAFQKLVENLPDIQLSPHLGIKSRVLGRFKTIQRGGNATYGHAYSHYAQAFDTYDDQALANVYSETALDLLAFGCRKRFDFTQKDFARFAPNNIGAVDWLSPRSRKRWSLYWEGKLES